MKAFHTKQNYTEFIEVRLVDEEQVYHNQKTENRDYYDNVGLVPVHKQTKYIVEEL